MYIIIVINRHPKWIHPHNRRVVYAGMSSAIHATLTVSQTSPSEMCRSQLTPHSRHAFSSGLTCCGVGTIGPCVCATILQCVCVCVLMLCVHVRQNASAAVRCVFGSEVLSLSQGVCINVRSYVRYMRAYERSHLSNSSCGYHAPSQPGSASVCWFDVMD